MEGWQLNGMVSFHGRAYIVKAIMIDHETGRIEYTLNNADLRYEWLTVWKPL